MTTSSKNQTGNQITHAYSKRDSFEKGISFSPEQVIGRKIRELRNTKGLSLKNTAELSGLNINTLSLIENGKTSPSVSTLQQLAKALNVSIVTFFESEPVKHSVVYTPHTNRPTTTFGATQMQNLGMDLERDVVQPFVITLKHDAGSGNQSIVHTGYEFAYCLSGNVQYNVDQIDYFLEAGDSLVFEAHLPHRWMNISTGESQLIIVFYPTDPGDEPGGRHFLR